MFPIPIVVAVSIPPPTTPPTNGTNLHKFIIPFYPNFVTSLNPTC